MSVSEGDFRGMLLVRLVYIIPNRHREKVVSCKRAGICLIFVMDTGNLQPLYQWIIKGNSRITIYDQ